jgi:hypothetical protein
MLLSFILYDVFNVFLLTEENVILSTRQFIHPWWDLSIIEFEKNIFFFDMVRIVQQWFQSKNKYKRIKTINLLSGVNITMYWVLIITLWSSLLFEKDWSLFYNLISLILCIYLFWLKLYIFYYTYLNRIFWFLSKLDWLHLESAFYS